MSKPVVYIVLYSLYHHVYKLALSIQEGLESKGVQVELFQVQETLNDEILGKMQAPAKPDLPIMTAEKLAEPDGILFGLPTRFGIFPAQMKALLDASGSLWAKGALAGKFAGTFFSTASQHGGQETTALTAVTYFAHQGMMYVPFGFADPALFDNTQVIGGSAYGAGTITNGDGSRQPSALELQVAKHQGENFGDILVTFVKGKSTSSSSAAVQQQQDVNSALKPTDAATADPEKTTAPATNTTTTATDGTTTAPTSATGNIATNGNATAVGAAAGAVAAGAAVTGAATTAAVKNDATDTATAKTDATIAGSSVKQPTTTNNTTTANAATTKSASTAAADNDLAALSAIENAKKMGKDAGERAAGATSSVPTNLKDNTPKKKSKWWCCGGF